MGDGGRVEGGTWFGFGTGGFERTDDLRSVVSTIERLVGGQWWVTYVNLCVRRVGGCLPYVSDGFQMSWDGVGRGLEHKGKGLTVFGRSSKEYLKYVKREKVEVV